jgi:hypothetical protein
MFEVVGVAGSGQRWVLNVGRGVPVSDTWALGSEPLPEPTIVEARAYAMANATDEELSDAIHVLLNRRAAMVAALTAAGEPTTNARIDRIDTLIVALGKML